MVQGTFTGIGERCGNCDLSTIIPNLTLKRGISCGKNAPVKLGSLMETARRISDISNVAMRPTKPYTGKSAFTHKGGMHIDATEKLEGAYEHIDPSLVGNKRRLLQYGNVVCQCTGAKNAHSNNRVQIMGDEGYLEIGPMSSNCQHVHLVRKGQEDVVLSLPENQWFYEIQAIAKLGNEKAYTICYENLETSLIIVEILEKARQSAGIHFPG